MARFLAQLPRDAIPIRRRPIKLTSPRSPLPARTRTDYTASMPVTYRDEEIEALSGKDAGDENFPVGSWLIRAELRPVVAAFYAFARAGDDIADAGHLDAAEKHRRLDAYQAVLIGQATGLTRPERLARALERTGVTPVHALHLLDAFRQDADTLRYRSLDELMGYCALSADPVGRFLLDLHGEDRALWPASDGLCSALQILNHLQDCGDDRKTLDRVYIPLDWLASEGDGIEALDRNAVSPAFRRVIDGLLDHCDMLLDRAEALVPGLVSRRLAAESAVILRLARRLSGRLRDGDPLAERVALSKRDFAFSGLGGAWSGIFGSNKPAERRTA